MPSHKGSNKAEVSLKSNIVTIIFKIGDKTVENNKIKPVTPTEFFINELLVSIKPTPSDKYEPSIGI